MFSINHDATVMTPANFAAAQERLAARHRSREEETQARLQQEHARYAEGPLNRLPFPLSRIGRAGVTTWDTIKGREGTRPVFRVGQVDAELLDEELLDLLNGQVGEALKYLGSYLQDDWSAEIAFCLQAILFKLTIWDHNSSYGAALQNLHYVDARDLSSARLPPKKWQKSLYGLVTVGGRYGWTKWEDWLLSREGGYDEPSTNVRRLSRLTTLASTTHSVVAFASFLVFLLDGKYRTLLDRILRLRLAPATAQVSREVSFEYLNRQLVWHAFTEFLLFLLPLVGISRWRRWLSRAWRKIKSTVVTEGEENDAKTTGELGFLPERTCAICYQDQNPTSAPGNEISALGGASGGVIGSAQTDITNPYETVPCGCIYCFVCLAHSLEAEEGEGWTCLRCGELVKECKPWSGDVLDEISRPSSGKSVGFVMSEKGTTKVEPMSAEDKVDVDVQTTMGRGANLSSDEPEQWEEINGEGAADDEVVSPVSPSLMDESLFEPNSLGHG